MQSLFSGMTLAFAMYSRIPTPKAKWKESSMEYALCFFPLVGLVIDGALWLFSLTAALLPISHTLYTVLLVLLPLVITGGIHMDGLLDTLDALGSHQTSQRKLEILKDPHAGAFAILGCTMYLLLSFGIWFEVDSVTLPVLMAGFVLSRSLSGISVLTFPHARTDGLASTFSKHAKRKTTLVVLSCFLLASACIMIWLQPVCGGLGVGSALLFFFYYQRLALREFGGVTGDLAGYFLQMCELILAAAVVIGGWLCG